MSKGETFTKLSLLNREQNVLEIKMKVLLSLFFKLMRSCKKKYSRFCFQRRKWTSK